MTERVFLGDLVTTIESGFACGKSNLVHAGLPHLRPFNIGVNGTFDFSEIYQVPPNLAPASKSTLESGDILFNNTNSRELVGKLAYVESHIQAGFSNHITRMRLDEARCQPQFVAYALQRLWTSGYFRDGSTQWVNQAAFGPRLLMKVPIALPKLDEQRRIVGILNRAARIERLLTLAEERLREFIPALFIRMFGDPSVNPLYRGVAQLGEVCTVVGGGTPRRSNGAYFGGSIPWATPTDVTALVGLTIESTRETLTETGLRESSARLIPAGTVLLTSRATIGYTAIAAAPMATNQGFANLTCGERLLPEYLAFWLRLRRNHLVQLAGGTTFKEISKSALKKIEIPLPPLELQYCFANLIASVIRVISETEIASDSAARLSTSLMSRLLRAAA